MIEVEIRTFISAEKYKEAISSFKNKNIAVKEEKQITTYFKGEKDFRLMETKEYCQLWLKDGQIHDEAREELVVKVDTIYRESLIKMLQKLGYEEEIKWYRVRNSLMWNDVYVTIDYTYGYGYILELELQVSENTEAEKAKQRLKKLFDELNINVAEKQVFKEKYEDYKVNWRKYTKEINKEKFIY